MPTAAPLLVAFAVSILAAELPTCADNDASGSTCASRQSSRANELVVAARGRTAAVRAQLDDLVTRVRRHRATVLDAEDRARAANAEAESARTEWRQAEQERQKLHSKWRSLEASQQRVERVQLGVASPPAALAHPEARDYYGLLGVSSGASGAEIKRAFHERALSHHPDKVADAVERARAEEAFQLLARASEVLTHTRLRSAYDAGENVDDPKVEKRVRD